MHFLFYRKFCMIYGSDIFDPGCVMSELYLASYIKVICAANTEENQ